METSFFNHLEFLEELLQGVETVSLLGCPWKLVPIVSKLVYKLFTGLTRGLLIHSAGKQNVSTVTPPIPSSNPSHPIHTPGPPQTNGWLDMCIYMFLSQVPSFFPS